MAFDFPPALRARLAAIRADQCQHTTHPLPPDAVSVLVDLWAIHYLTSDGRVVIEDEDQPIAETTDPFTIHVTLIRAAERFALPELRRFLPSCPPAGRVCPTCQGTRYLPFPNAGMFCRPCHARGWVEGPA